MSDRQEAIDAAARLLRHGDRSRAELERRLSERGIELDVLVDALDALERVGVLDDGRTAALRAARLAERGYGDAYIRAELARRGLPVEEGMAELEPETVRAVRLLAQRRNGKSGAAWLARRGFDAESLESAVAAEPP